MQQQRHPAGSDTNKVSKVSVEIDSDINNYYVSLTFDQCDDVYDYYEGYYNDLSGFIENNVYTERLEKGLDTEFVYNLKLVKNNLPRYATVTLYAENGELKAQPVQYTNTPFA